MNADHSGHDNHILLKADTQQRTTCLKCKLMKTLSVQEQYSIPVSPGASTADVIERTDLCCIERKVLNNMSNSLLIVLLYS